MLRRQRLLVGLGALLLVTHDCRLLADVAEEIIMGGRSPRYEGLSLQPLFVLEFKTFAGFAVCHSCSQ